MKIQKTPLCVSLRFIFNLPSPKYKKIKCNARTQTHTKQMSHVTSFHSSNIHTCVIFKRSIRLGCIFPWGWNSVGNETRARLKMAEIVKKGKLGKESETVEEKWRNYQRFIYKFIDISNSFLLSFSPYKLEYKKK